MTVTRNGGLPSDAMLISIHAHHVGCDMNAIKVGNVILMFQSTHPHGVRHKHK